MGWTGSPQAAFSGHPRIKGRRSFPHPVEESGKSGMRAQGHDRVVIACQFGLGQRGMDFAMADVMKKHGFTPLAPFQAGGQVVAALLCAGWNRTVAQRTYRVGHVPFKPGETRRGKR